MPTGVLATRSPMSYSALPTGLARPKTSRSAMPATGCGMTSGKSMRADISARPLNVRRASRYATGVPPRTPRKVAIVAVVAVRTSDDRSSASDPKLATPRVPPAATRPTTGPSRNRRKSDASTATTVAITARETALGRRGADTVSRTLIPGCTAKLRRRAGADDDRPVEHVDVGASEFLYDVLRGEIGEE